MKIGLSVGIPGTPEYGLGLHIKSRTRRSIRNNRDGLAGVLSSFQGTSRSFEWVECCFPLESAAHLANCIQFVSCVLWEQTDLLPVTPL